VDAANSEPSPSGTRRAEQVVLLLDSSARVLSVNKSLAGKTFSGLVEDNAIELHTQLHPNCDANCRFVSLWNKAWNCLSATGSIEWEIEDAVLNKLLRVNLSESPSTGSVKHDRRRGHALLMITDITKLRHDYNSLIERERALLKLLRKHGVDPDSSANDDSTLPDNEYSYR